MKNNTFALPTNDELVELFQAATKEHQESPECNICMLRKEWEANTEVHQLAMHCLLLTIEGPSAFIAAFAHFFRAGMLWQEKTQGINKDSDELLKLFNMCDPRSEK